MQPHGKRSCMWFAGNDMGDDGPKQLAKSLANNTTLTSLDLRGTRWFSMTPACVRLCLYTCWCSTAMQSQTKPDVNPGFKTLTVILMLALTLTLTSLLTLTITLTLNPVP